MSSVVNSPSFVGVGSGVGLGFGAAEVVAVCVGSSVAAGVGVFWVACAWGWVETLPILGRVRSHAMIAEAIKHTIISNASTILYVREFGSNTSHPTFNCKDS